MTIARCMVLSASIFIEFLIVNKTWIGMQHLPEDESEIIELPFIVTTADKNKLHIISFCPANCTVTKNWIDANASI